jgi:hypothetical protein
MSQPTPAQSAFALAPFTTEIHVNGYAVKDCKGFIFVVCRSQETAKLIVEALHALARTA